MAGMNSFSQQPCTEAKTGTCGTDSYLTQQPGAQNHIWNAPDRELFDPVIWGQRPGLGCPEQTTGRTGSPVLK